MLHCIEHSSIRFYQRLFLYSILIFTIFLLVFDPSIVSVKQKTIINYIVEYANKFLYYNLSLDNKDVIIEAKSNNLFKGDIVFFLFYPVPIVNLTYFEPVKICTIITAAVHNPDRQVYLYISCELSKNRSQCRPFCPKLFKHHSNIHCKTFSAKEVLNQTGVAEWYFNLNGSRLIRDSKHPYHNLADLVRLAWLYKFGGIYLDLDMFTVRQYDADALLNSVSREENFGSINNAWMYFEPKHPFIRRCLELAGSRFDNDWASLGPRLLSHVHWTEYANYHQQIADAAASNKSTANQRSVGHHVPSLRILNYTSVYPVHLSKLWHIYAAELFNEATNMITNNDTYAIHLYWEFYDQQLIRNGSLLCQLMIDHCASVLRDISHFGIKECATNIENRF